MNYLDVYFSRINHLGDTIAERIRNGGIRSFEKWKAESPHTVQDLSVERGLYFDGIILTNKDKEYQKIMFLNVANDIPIKVGDIMNWTLDNGDIEKWLLIQEEKKVNGTYKTFWIVRCNYLMKWIDKQGHLQQSQAYFVSSLDSKIKGNFRTWNSLITPQPNKYAEILMPRYPIDRATNFIVEEESWSVVEYDHTSVPGVIYISLTENKINSIYDDVKNNIADLDKKAKYEIVLPKEKQNFSIGTSISPKFILMKNGIPYEEEVELVPLDKEYARIINGELIAKKEGETEIIVRLKQYPEVFQKTISINITAEETPFSAYIKGADVVRLDRVSYYILEGTQPITEQVSFSIIEGNEYAIISPFTDEEKENLKDFNQKTWCKIQANHKNLLGNFTLQAEINNQNYTKQIKIIPLW